MTSHDSNAVFIYQRKSRSDDRYKKIPIQILKGEKTHFCCPHSLSFHPVNDALAVSSSQGRKNVNIFTKKSEGSSLVYQNAPDLSLEIIEMYDDSTLYLLDQLRQEGGVKGVTFSPDGKSLAITQNLCQDLLVLPFPVGVLAIYPVNID